MAFMDSVRSFGAAFPWPVRAFGRGFLSYGNVMGMWISFIMMFTVYWLVLPFFLFLKFSDKGMAEKPHAESFWENWKKVEHTIERFSRPF